MCLKLILKITVLDHKIKTSSTFLVTLKMKDLIFPTSFSVFSNQFYAFYINRNIYIYILHIKKEQPKINLKDYLQIANLWSHYLSKLAALHSLLVLFIWSSRLLVSAHFLDMNQCWQWMFQKQAQRIDWCLCHNRYKTGTVCFLFRAMFTPLKCPIFCISVPRLSWSC